MNKVFPLPPVTFDLMSLDGKTVELKVAEEGDLVVLMAREVGTGIMYLLKIAERRRDGRMKVQELIAILSTLPPDVARRWWAQRKGTS